MHFSLRNRGAGFWFWMAAISVILSARAARAQSPEVAPANLPGTSELLRTGDLSTQMREDVDRFLLTLGKQVHDSARGENRLRGEQGRQRFARQIGVVDRRVDAPQLQVVTSVDEPPRVLEVPPVRITAVRWPVFQGVNGEGLLLEPRDTPRAFVIALPDADWTPEAISGIGKAPLPDTDYAWQLAAAGCRVLVPTLIDRRDNWSGNPAVRELNQPHREFIYRPAFYLGRHIIGYEVQKVLAGVDYFAQRNRQQGTACPIGVCGYGEGALIAFYSAAVDTRIDAVLVSGYFQQRVDLWREPIYRNVWGLLRDFGDAGIARLVAPRGLVVEAARGIELDGPPPPREGGRSYAATGRLVSPPIESVRSEFARVKQTYNELGAATNVRLIESHAEAGPGTGPPGSPDALQAFLQQLGVDSAGQVSRAAGEADALRTDPDRRMERQVRELVDFNQFRFWEASRKRDDFWKAAKRSSVVDWKRTAEPYRQLLLNEVIGDWPLEETERRVRTRRSYETMKWIGYEVTIDIAPQLWAYGVMLIPRDIQAGEKLPVVVAQHGRGGGPRDICDPSLDSRTYHHFGATLADQRYIVFAPQNLYFGEEHYRLLQRKANPLGLSFFAPMVWQHRAIVDWLQSLSYVAADRIGFYGISYGGKSALLIPAVISEYALSICSGAFTDTVRKHIDAVGGNRSVFLFTNEYEHLEFDFAEKFNHAEIAWLISPRPFMVEKGHWDGGLPDEWTAFEYARVRRHYVGLGIAERTAIEFFSGGHEINETGTYQFLNDHLRR